jgi:hypothetical protein
VFNFYRRFVPAAAKILRPLTDSTRGSPKATAAVDWTPPMVAAFDAARTALGAAALLAHPQQDQELAVMVDASADHVGAALQQRRSAAADWQPLAFFTKKLEPAQMRYSAFDRELFACVAGIHHFRYMLEGRPFTIYTDHKPLTFALGKVSEPWTAMQSRQLSYVAKFTTDIRHIPGSENIVADTPGRPSGGGHRRPGGRGISRESGQPGLCQDSDEPEVLPGDIEGGPLLFVAAAARGHAGGEGRL